MTALRDEARFRCACANGRSTLEMSIPTGMLLINNQGMAVCAMASQVRVIERQVVMRMFDLREVFEGPNEQANQEASTREHGKTNQSGDTAMCCQKPS